MNASTGPIWRDGALPSGRMDPLHAGFRAARRRLSAARAARRCSSPSRERFLAHEGPLGVEVAAGESVDALEPLSLAADADRAGLPEILRRPLLFRRAAAARAPGFKGELRAIGDVLADQIPLMRRCGIESFEVRHAPTRAALLAGRLAEMHHYLSADPDRAARSAGRHAAVAAGSRRTDYCGSIGEPISDRYHTVLNLCPRLSDWTQAI